MATNELSLFATELPAEVFPQIVDGIGVVKALALEQGFGVSRPGESPHGCCGNLCLGAVLEEHAADAGFLDGASRDDDAVIAQQDNLVLAEQSGNGNPLFGRDDEIGRFLELFQCRRIERTAHVGDRQETVFRRGNNCGVDRVRVNDAADFRVGPINFAVNWKFIVPFASAGDLVACEIDKNEIVFGNFL